MPALFIDAEDDPLIFDGQDSFTGGMVSNARASSLEGNQSPLLQNVICDRPGVVRNRGGFFYTSPTFPTTQPGIDYGIAQLLSFLRQGAGQFPTLCALTEPDNTGSVTFATLAGSVWTSIATIVLPTAFPPIGTPTMTQAGDVVYMALGAGVQFRKWDGTTVTTVSAGTPQPPPAGGIVAYHTGRLFVSGLQDEPDAVYVGDVGPVGTDLENFGGGGTTAGLSGQVRVGTGQDGRIVALLPWTGTNLLVFKQNAIYVIAADPSIPVANWEIQRVTRSVGCVAPRSIAQLGDDVLFLGADGVYSIARVIASDKQGTVNLPLSWPIQDQFDGTQAYGNSARAIDQYWSGVVFQGRYILASPVSFRGIPVPGVLPTPFALVYNQKLQAWEGVWNSTANGGYLLNGSCWTVHDGALYCGSPGPRVLVFAPLAAADQGGETITKIVRTRGMRFNEPLNPKKGSFLRIEMKDQDADATVTLYIDGSALPRDTVGTVTISPDPPLPPPGYVGTLARVFDLQRFEPFDEVSACVTATTAAVFGLAGLGLGAWLETLPLEKLR